MNSPIPFERSWRFSSKSFIKMLAVAQNPHWILRLCGVHTAAGIFRLSMGCCSSGNHGDLTAWLHLGCSMPYKRCPNLCFPMVVGSKWLCSKQFTPVPVGLPEVPSSHLFTWGGAVSGTWVMSDGRWSMASWKFLQYTTSGREMVDSHPALAKARSGFVPEFQRAEWKLSGSFALYRRVRLLADAHSTRKVPSLFNLETPFSVVSVEIASVDAGVVGHR